MNLKSVIMFLCLVSIHLSMMAGNKYECMQEIRKTLFNTTGKSLGSAEENIDNLFKNFPIMIQNASRVKFESYQYVGIVKNGKKATSYLKKNFTNGPQWKMNMKHAADGSAKGNLTGKVASIDTDVIPFSKEKAGMMADEWAEQLVGYSVYMIRFTLDMQAYKYYIFIDTNTNEVFLLGNIFGFSFE